jgi:hypothetical protein
MKLTRLLIGAFSLLLLIPILDRSDFSEAKALGDSDPIFCRLVGAHPTCDICEELGWYNDGICDDFCDKPDYADCGIEPAPGMEEMNALLEYFKEAVDVGDIIGVGASLTAESARLRAFKRMLDSAADLLVAEDEAGACEALTDAALSTDGINVPLDFVEGDGVPTLNAMILYVMYVVGCN